MMHKIIFSVVILLLFCYIANYCSTVENLTLKQDCDVRDRNCSVACRNRKGEFDRNCFQQCQKISPIC